MFSIVLPFGTIYTNVYAHICILITSTVIFATTSISILVKITKVFQSIALSKKTSLTA